MSAQSHSSAIKKLAEAAASLPNAKIKVKIKAEPKKGKKNGSKSDT